MLDLRPGLAAYARASYDLEQRGRDRDAEDLMRRALAAAADPHDIAFCRNQLGDLAWTRGDLDAAAAQYAAGLAADPDSVAPQRGTAPLALARGRTDAALPGYAGVTRRAPCRGRSWSTRKPCAPPAAAPTPMPGCGSPPLPTRCSGP